MFKYANGDEYDGEFSNGKCIGTGILKKIDGDVFNGKFDGRFTEGMIIYSDGNVYTGSVIQGRIRHGKGQMKWENGEIYEGDFKQDEFSGNVGKIARKSSRYFPTSTFRENTSTSMAIHTWAISRRISSTVKELCNI